MNKFLVLSDYATKPTDAVIAANADITLAANELKDASGAFINMASAVTVDSTEPRVGFTYKNIKGKLEGLIMIEKPVEVIKIEPVTAVKKVGVWKLAGNIEALEVGQTIMLMITNLTKDIYDPKRNIAFEYTLTTLDNLTTASNASYYVKRMASYFNAKHSDFGTMAHVGTDEGKFKITPVEVIDFTVSSGGIFPYLIETASGTDGAVEYVAPIGTAAQIEEQELWYSTERGNTNAITKQNTKNYVVPSAVIAGKTYIQYVMSWKHLTTEHSLGQGTHPVLRTLVLAIPSDATNQETLDAAMDGLFGTSFAS